MHLRTFNGHKTNIVSIEWIQMAPSDIELEIETKIRRNSNASQTSSQTSLSPVEATIKDDGGTQIDETEGLSASINGLSIDNDNDAFEIDTNAEQNADSPAPTAVVDEEPISYLATGAEEPLVYIWDTKNNSIAHTIRLKTHGRHSIPSETSKIIYIHD